MAPRYTIAGVIIVSCIGLYMLIHLTQVKPVECSIKNMSERRTPSSGFEINSYPIRGPMKVDWLNGPTQREFTMNGRVALKEVYYFGNEGYLGDGKDVQIPKIEYPNLQPVLWKTDELTHKLELAKARQVKGLTLYGLDAPRDVYAAIDAYPLEGKKVLVVGSINPWLECIAIGYGKAQTPVYTVDFNKPQVEGDEMRNLFVTTDIAEFDEMVVNGLRFDAILSFSSIEHDGLGRYGDPINPNGDVERVKRFKNFLNPGGLLYLAVPIGNDTVVFNAHRIYGNIRWPYLVSEWDVLGHFDPDAYGPPEKYMAYSKSDHQLVHVLKVKQKLSN